MEILLTDNSPFKKNDTTLDLKVLKSGIIRNILENLDTRLLYTQTFKIVVSNRHNIVTNRVEAGKTTTR